MKYLILFVFSLFVAMPCSGQDVPSREALNLLAKGDLRAAIRVLDLEVKDSRNLFENLRLRADVKRMTGDFQGAFEDVTKALSFKTTGELYRSRAELASILRHDPASILRDLDSAISAGMKHERVYSSRGTIKMHSGDMTGAIEDLKIAVGMNPDFAQAYIGLSSAYRMNKDKQKSIEVLEGYLRRYEEGLQKVDSVKGKSKVVSSIELPVQPSKGVVVGQETTVIMSGRMAGPPSPEEIAQMNERFERSKNTSLAYANLAQMYEESELYEQALATVEKAMAIDSTDFFAYSARANARIGLRDYEGALADINLAIKKNPSVPIFYRTRGLANLMLNRTSEADTDFSTFLEKFPNGKEELERRKALALKIRDTK